jgi:hypothetical protein
MAWNSAKWRAVLLDLLERAGWSAGQVFFATLIGGGTTVAVANLPWKYSLTVALSAAVSSVILTVLQYLVRATNLAFWPDMIVRLGKTFLASVAATIAAAEVFDVTTFSWTAALNLAALATITAFGKGLLARGQTQTGSTTAPGAAATAATAGRNPSTLPTPIYSNAIRA